jgi:NAD(P)H dehydrogenase (quinone)
MKHLVVIAHPRIESFNMNVMRTYVDALEARGHEVVIRDLYRIGFNPVATPEDLNAMKDGMTIPEDIRVEQNHIRWADVITFIYPVWWISLPAILKGYVDKVFLFGFAYGHTPDGVKGLLPGKKAVVFTSSGSKADHFQESGKLQSVNTAIQLGTMEFCALDMVDHIHFAPVGRFTTQEMVDQWTQDIRALVEENF